MIRNAFLVIRVHGVFLLVCFACTCKGNGGKDEGSHVLKLNKVFTASGAKTIAISPYEGIVLSAVCAYDYTGNIGAGAAVYVLQSLIVDFRGRVLGILMEFIVLIHDISSLNCVLIVYTLPTGIHLSLF